MENARKQREIKLVTAHKTKPHLVSEPNYHTTKYFSENLLATEINKINVKKNKPASLDLSFRDIRKIAMHEY